MKKILYFGVLAAMLLGTASCANDVLDEPADGSEVQVSFIANLGDNIDSRTISDGTKADVLRFFVYEDGQEIQALRQLSVPVVGKHAQVTTKLVKGHTYSFVFYAEHNGNTFWGLGLSATGPTITMRPGSSRNPIKCNDDEADAFYNVLKDYRVTSSFTEDVTLYRPFAQINILASDAASVTDFENYTSSINGWTGDVKFPESMNLLTGETTGNTMGSILENVLPTEPLPGYEQYKFVCTRYVLAPVEQMIVSNINFTLKYNNSARGLTIPNIPIRRNYRTNIIGDFFTEGANYTVEINPMYETPDYNEEYPEVTDVAILNGQNYETLDAAIAAAETGATITLAPGTYSFSSLNKSVKIVGKSKERSIVEFINKAYGCGGADVYFENLTLRVGRENYKGFQHSNSETYKNIIFEGGHLTLYGTTATFDGCTFNQSIYDYSFWAYGPTTTNVTNCVFNTVGKAIKLYQESSTITRTLNVNNTTFNVTARGNGNSSIKAAIEIDGTRIQTPFAVNITNATVNGHDPGEVSGSTLWNCDTGSKATVVVDGETVYQQN